MDEVYVEIICRKLGDLIQGLEPGLLRLYGLLVLTTGTNTTLENVHDARSFWRLGTKLDHPYHPSLVPFSQLDQDVQELYREYVHAIHEVTRSLSDTEQSQEL
jgi:hypothetical protein